MRAGSDLERHANRFEADPRIKSFGKTCMLAHDSQRRDSLRVEQPKIAGAFRQGGFPKRAEKLVKALRQHPPQRRIR